LKKIKKKEILIAGGTGFIGFHLAEKCISKGMSVTSISTKYPRKDRKLRGVKYLVCDLFKKKELQKLIKKNYDFVVNLGGYVDHNNKKKTHNSHYIGCKNLSNILLKKKIINFIQMGSSSEYGKLPSPHDEKKSASLQSIYGKSKYSASKYLLNLYKKKKFPVTVLRLYQAYGPGQDANRLIPFIIKSCIKNEKFPCSTGNQFRDFIHVDDVIRAILKCFNNKKAVGNIINIGTGRPKKVREVIGFIHRKIKTGYPQFGKIKLRKDEILRVYPKISKAKKILQWWPIKNFDKSIFATIKWYKKNN
jgi:nucleoside-diphosphate-sugar epimerase|tara:strand:- start:3152 stop:4066 length:915 start_codon:yes stop_codon:yes gene_type:complete